MISGEHENQPLSFVNGIEESDISDSIPPGLRDGVPKLLDILADVRARSKLGIDVRGELVVDACLLSTEVLLEVFLKLCGLENAKVSQRTCPYAA